MSNYLPIKYWSIHELWHKLIIVYSQLVRMKNLAFYFVFCFCFTLNASEFKSLFNGKNLDGWSHNGNWDVQDGVISRTGKGGSLVYKTEVIPDDFELQFEWKVAAKSNSGVYYRPGQYEYQILDNQGHGNGSNPRTSAASLYFCMQPSHDATKPVGQWNQGKIICKDSVIQHWLNGHKVIDMDYKDPKYAFNVEMLKQRGADLNARGAHLSLQDHGDPVWYRNIKLRTIEKHEKLDRTPVTPAIIPTPILEAEKKKLAATVARKNKTKKEK